MAGYDQFKDYFGLSCQAFPWSSSTNTSCYVRQLQSALYFDSSELSEEAGSLPHENLPRRKSRNMSQFPFSRQPRDARLCFDQTVACMPDSIPRCSDSIATDRSHNIGLRNFVNSESQPRYPGAFPGSRVNPKQEVNQAECVSSPVDVFFCLRQNLQGSSSSASSVKADPTGRYADDYEVRSGFCQDVHRLQKMSVSDSQVVSIGAWKDDGGVSRGTLTERVAHSCEQFPGHIQGTESRPQQHSPELEIRTFAEPELDQSEHLSTSTDLRFSLQQTTHFVDRMEQILLDAVEKKFRERANRLEQAMCVFCHRNGETVEYCKTHVIKDNRGKVVCPVLRKYVCPKCRATGDNAHTLRHCPLLKNIASVSETFKTARTSVAFRKPPSY